MSERLGTLVQLLISLNILPLAMMTNTSTSNNNMCHEYNLFEKLNTSLSSNNPATNAATIVATNNDILSASGSAGYFLPSDHAGAMSLIDQSELLCVLLGEKFYAVHPTAQCNVPPPREEAHPETQWEWDRMINKSACQRLKALKDASSFTITQFTPLSGSTGLSFTHPAIFPPAMELSKSFLIANSSIPYSGTNSPMNTGIFSSDVWEDAVPSSSSHYRSHSKKTSHSSSNTTNNSIFYLNSNTTSTPGTSHPIFTPTVTPGLSGNQTTNTPSRDVFGYDNIEENILLLESRQHKRGVGSVGDTVNSTTHKHKSHKHKSNKDKHKSKEHEIFVDNVELMPSGASGLGMGGLHPTTVTAPIAIPTSGSSSTGLSNNIINNTSDSHSRMNLSHMLFPLQDENPMSITDITPTTSTVSAIAIPINASLNPPEEENHHHKQKKEKSSKKKSSHDVGEHSSHKNSTDKKSKSNKSNKNVTLLDI